MLARVSVVAKKGNCQSETDRNAGAAAASLMLFGVTQNVSIKHNKAVGDFVGFDDIDLNVLKQIYRHESVAAIKFETR